jgi:hypothetical protein
MSRFKILISLVLMVNLAVLWYTPGVRAEMTNPQEVPATSIMLTFIEIYLNGQEAPLDYAAFIDTRERAVISLTDCSLIFGAQIEVIDTRLLLRKGTQELLIEAEDYLRLPPVQTQDISEPEQQLDEFYLPMRLVAEELGYKINYNHKVAAAILRSSDYQGPDPQFAPPEPPSIPTNLPRWGTLASAPVMTELWPSENIIAGYYTSIAGSPASRNHNIKLSCEKLNGTIVNSGEVCSFNHTVGKRTAEAGYQTAGVIMGKRLVSGIGGGICQTATTLYNSILESQLEVVERHPHTLRIGYVPVNRDATVSWGGADLKFRNNKSYPLKILAQVYGNYVIFAIAAADYQ